MKYIHIIYLSVILAVVSCTKQEYTENDSRLIYLQISTEGEAAPAVKSPYTAEIPSVSRPLSVLVLASTTSHQYPDTGADGTDGTVAVHTAATFTSGEKQLLGGALYPTVEYPGGIKEYPTVYFSSLYPYIPDEDKTWSVTQSMINDALTYKASYIFNGSEDVMYAPQTTGHYALEGISEEDKVIPSLTFRHLLTYIRFFIYADNEDIANAWGEIKSISIRNSSDMGPDANKAIVNLGDGSVEFVRVSEYSPAIYSTGTDNEFLHSGNYSLLQDADTYVPKEVAYTLLAPVDAMLTDKENASIYIPEFELDIVTSNRSVTVNIDLMKNASEYYVGSTMGKRFDITLKFTMGNTVAAQAKVTSWLTGGIGVGDFNE